MLSDSEAISGRSRLDSSKFNRFCVLVSLDDASQAPPEPSRPPGGEGSALADRAPRGCPPGGAHYVRLPSRRGWVLEGGGTMGPGAPGAACGRLVTDGGRFPILNKLCAARVQREK